MSSGCHSEKLLINAMIFTHTEEKLAGHCLILSQGLASWVRRAHSSLGKLHVQPSSYLSELGTIILTLYSLCSKYYQSPTRAGGYHIYAGHLVQLVVSPV